jgi:hypothetical protein
MVGVGGEGAVAEQEGEAGTWHMTWQVMSKTGNRYNMYSHVQLIIGFIESSSQVVVTGLLSISMTIQTFGLSLDNTFIHPFHYQTIACRRWALLETPPTPSNLTQSLRVRQMRHEKPKCHAHASAS